MNAAALGYWIGLFLIHGLLPAAFILYGRRNRRSGAVTFGAVVLGLLVVSWLNQFARGNESIADSLGAFAGWALCAVSFSAKPKPSAPPALPEP